MHSGLTSVRVVSIGASVGGWGWTSLSGPIAVVCSVLSEPAEWCAVLVKVTGGQLYSWK